jgi:hypothetical protein
MNETQVERWLADRFRAAPSPEPPTRLMLAVSADRARDVAVPRWRWPIPRWRLPAFAGVAAVACLAAGLITIAIVRAPEGPAAANLQISWHAPVAVPTDAMDSPVLASAGGVLYLIGNYTLNETTTTEVWSSADGANWEMAPEGAFQPGSVPLVAGDDGAGNVLIAGDVASTVDGVETVAPAAWHLSDGGTFTKVSLDGPAGDNAWVLAVAAEPGRVVMLGERSISSSQVSSGSGGSSVLAWYSSDGKTFAHVELPDSAGYFASSIAHWSGGFIALASDPSGAPPVAAWISSDGAVWTKVELPASLALGRRILGIGDQVYVVGARMGSDGVRHAAAWSSPDGRKWTESDAPVPGACSSFVQAAAVGDSVVAVAWSSECGNSTGSSGADTAPTQTGSVWILHAGTWRQATDPPAAVSAYIYLNIASFDGGVAVMAPNEGTDPWQVAIGDLVSAGATPSGTAASAPATET